MKKFIFIFLILMSCSTEELEIELVKEEKEEIIIEDIKHIKVDIKGFVLNPGVYELKNGSRINDLIEIAGGLDNNADVSILNLSKRLEDEMSVRIYSKDEINYYRNLAKQGPKIVEVVKEIEIIKEIEKECVYIDENNNNCSEEVETDNLIDINLAYKELLMTLPGIGESRALDIINYRLDNPFEKIEDLKNVSGIGDATFENVKHLIKV